VVLVFPVGQLPWGVSLVQQIGIEFIQRITTARATIIYENDYFAQ
jgi:hypothetical protein